MKTHFLVFCGIALVATLGCQGQGQMSSSGHKLKAADQAPPESEVELEPEPKILPKTYVAAGRLAEGRGDLILATSMYRKAIAISPAYADAYNRLGLVYAQLGYFRQAEESLKTAVRLDPEQAYMRNNLAYCYILQRRWQEAETELRRALEVEPEFARARVNLGMVLARTDRFDQAMVEFQRVLPPATAHYNLGLMYEFSRQYDLARASFAEALALNPRMSAARDGLLRMAEVAKAQQAEQSQDQTVMVASDSQAGPRDEAVDRVESQAIVEEAEPASAVLPSQEPAKAEHVEQSTEVPGDPPAPPPVMLPPSDESESSPVGPPVPDDLLSYLSQKRKDAEGFAAAVDGIFSQSTDISNQDAGITQQVVFTETLPRARHTGLDAVEAWR